jgi:hypothetical protein
MLDSLSSDERRDLILSVGTHKRKRRLSPIQIAKLVDRLYKIQGISLELIAMELSLKSSYSLKKFISLLSLPLELQPLITWGASPGYLSFSVAHEISKVKDNDKILILSKDAIENQRTSEEVRAIIQCNKRKGGSISQCIEQIEAIQGKVVQHYVFLGQILSIKNQSQSDEEYSCKLRYMLSELVEENNVLSATAKDMRFSFTLTKPAIKNSRIASHLTPDKLEAFVTKLIMNDSTHSINL